jgi:hypothetical protein
MRQGANMLCAGAVLLLEDVEDRRRFRQTRAQEAEQVFAFARVVHALGEGVRCSRSSPRGRRTGGAAPRSAISRTR